MKVLQITIAFLSIFGSVSVSALNCPDFTVRDIKKYNKQDEHEEGKVYSDIPVKQPKDSFFEGATFIWATSPFDIDELNELENIKRITQTAVNDHCTYTLELSNAKQKNLNAYLSQVEPNLCPNLEKNQANEFLKDDSNNRKVTYQPPGSKFIWNFEPKRHMVFTQQINIKSLSHPEQSIGNIKKAELVCTYKAELESPNLTYEFYLLQDL